MRTPSTILAVLVAAALSALACARPTTPLGDGDLVSFLRAGGVEGGVRRLRIGVDGKAVFQHNDDTFEWQLPPDQLARLTAAIDGQQFERIAPPAMSHDMDALQLECRVRRAGKTVQIDAGASGGVMEELRIIMASKDTTWTRPPKGQ